MVIALPSVVISRMENVKSHGITGEGDTDSTRAEQVGFKGRGGVPAFHCYSNCLG